MSSNISTVVAPISIFPSVVSYCAPTEITSVSTDRVEASVSNKTPKIPTPFSYPLFEASSPAVSYTHLTLPTKA